MRLKISQMQTSSSKTQRTPPQAAAAAVATPTTPEVWQHARSGAMEDVVFMAHSIGAPLAMLTIDPEANPVVVNVNLHPNGAVPCKVGAGVEPPSPVATVKYAPMSAADPDRAQQHDEAAPADSSLAWMSRFLVSYPGYVVIATRRTKTGRTMFAAVTRATRPGPVEPPPPPPREGTRRLQLGMRPGAHKIVRR